MTKFTVSFLVVLLFLLKFIDDSLKMRMFFVDIDFSTRNNILRQTKLSADREGIACSRYANQKPIGRPQCLEIKFDRGILHARLCVGIGFKSSVMRGCNNSDLVV